MAGKSTLIHRFFSKKNTRFDYKSKFEYCVSYTTKPRGKKEIAGKHYHFVSEEDFEDLRKEDKLFEHQKINGNLFGTSKSHLIEIIKKGKIPILDVDHEGYKSLKKVFPNINSVFVTINDEEQYKKRMECINSDKCDVESLQLKFDDAK